MSYSPPSVIDPVTSGSIPSEAQSTIALTFGPWKSGGKFYCVLQTRIGGVQWNFDAFGSVDGVTWTKLDAVNAPANTWCCVADFDDISNTIYCAVGLGVNTNPLLVFAFNCASETWGPQSANGPNFNGDLGNEIGLILASSNGCLIVYTDLATGFWSGVSFIGGAWGVPFSINANAILAYPTIVSNGGSISGCIDSTGNFHIFFTQQPTDLLGSSGVFYQQISSLFVPGSFVVVAIIPSVSNFDFTIGSPCVVSGNLAIVIQQSDNLGNWSGTLYIGTPLGLPVFTAIGPIDTITTTRMDWPVCFVNGFGALAIVSLTHPGFPLNQIIRLTTTLDFVTWNLTPPISLQDISIADPNGYVWFTDPNGNKDGISCDVFGPIGINGFRVFMPFQGKAQNVILPAHLMPSIVLPNPATGLCG